MEVVGLLIGVAIAVGGWVVNGVLSRREARREIRVQYLLNAYRSLDNASNRSAMTREHERALEEAVADILLLGSEPQVHLAERFAEEFAGHGNADTSALLEALRADLRRELLLGVVGPRRRWLRIEPGHQWATEFARVRAALGDGRAPAQLPPSSRPNDSLAETEYAEQIEAAFADVAKTAAARFPAIGADGSAVEIVQEVLRSGALSAGNQQALEGLDVMRDLALGDPSRVGSRERRDYATLARAVGYAIRTQPEDGR